MDRVIAILAAHDRAQEMLIEKLAKEELEQNLEQHKKPSTNNPLKR